MDRCQQNGTFQYNTNIPRRVHLLTHTTNSDLGDDKFVAIQHEDVNWKVWASRSSRVK